jgi:hypothetical protein
MGAGFADTAAKIDDAATDVKDHVTTTTDALGAQANAHHAATTANLAALLGRLGGGGGPVGVSSNPMAKIGHRPLWVTMRTHDLEHGADYAAIGRDGKASRKLVDPRRDVNPDYADSLNPFGYGTDTTTVGGKYTERATHKVVKLPLRPMEMFDSRRAAFDRGVERTRDPNRGRISRYVGGSVMMLYGLAQAPEIAGRALRAWGTRRGGIPGMAARATGNIISAVALADSGTDPLRRRRPSPLPNPGPTGTRTRRGRNGSVTTYYGN